MKIEKLKIEMYKNKISQKKLSQLLNKTEVTISRKFKNAHFNIEEMNIISKILNLSDHQKIEIFFN